MSESKSQPLTHYGFTLSAGQSLNVNGVPLVVVRVHRGRALFGFPRTGHADSILRQESVREKETKDIL